MMDDTTDSHKQRNHALDGLRGYGAIAVVFTHTTLVTPALITDIYRRGIQAQDTPYNFALKLVLSALNAEPALEMFFVLSGIVLFRSLNALHDSTRSDFGSSWRFLLRRLIRIWPVMAVCLIAVAVLFRLIDFAWPSLVDVPTVPELIDNLLLVRFPVIGSTWTLFVEIAAAPALLLCWLATRALGRWGLVLCGLYVAASLLDHALMFNSGLLLGAAPFFLAGVAIECGWLMPLMRSRLRRPAVLLALAVLEADVLFVPHVPSNLHLAGMIVSVPVLVGWVYATRDGRFNRFLEAPISRYVGRISFSFYVWNVPVFELILSVLGDRLRNHPLESGLAVGVAAIAITLPIAHFSERWLEQPCIELGRVLTSRRLPRHDPELLANAPPSTPLASGDDLGPLVGSV